MNGPFTRLTSCTATTDVGYLRCREFNREVRACAAYMALMVQLCRLYSSTLYLHTYR